jgi:phosphonate transport system substrate-binding protein
MNRYLKLPHIAFSMMFLAPLLAGTVFAADTASQQITFGLISTTNAEDTQKRWQPLIDDLAADTKLKVKVVASTNYSDIVNGLKNNKIQAAWMGSTMALNAVIDGKAVVFAQMVKEGGATGYNSVLVTQTNSAIKSLGDITGTPGLYSFADGDPESTSGHLIPDFYIFARNRLDPQKQFKKVIVGNHQKNLQAVVNNEVDIATNNTGELERLKKEAPDQYAKVRVFWTSPEIPLDPLLYRTDLPAETKAKLEHFFYTYGKQNKPAQAAVLDKILNLSGFQASTNAQLAIVAKLESFSQLRFNTNNTKLTEEQKKKAEEEINEHLKKLEAVIGAPASK